MESNGLNRGSRKAALKKSRMNPEPIAGQFLQALCRPAQHLTRCDELSRIQEMHD